MLVTLYITDKKPNSTADVYGGEDFVCEVFDSCTITDPVLIFSTSQVIYYNYCRIDAFGGRCYWIRNWEFQGGRWFAHCTVDVLGSYRDDILGSTQYISRCAHEGNGAIQDRVYVSSATPSVTTITATNPWEPSVSGTYVVSVLGGTTKYFAMSAGNFDSLVNYLFSDDYCDELFGGPGWLDTYPELKTQVNPLQYIGSVRWFPVNVGGGGSMIKVGWVTTPAVGSEVSPYMRLTGSASFEVPKHPQVSQYLNMPPYAEYTLYYPPFGAIQLDSTAMASASTLSCAASADPRTGECILEISVSGNVISRVHSTLGTEVQLGQITAPGWGPGATIQAAAGAIGAVAGVVGSALSGNIGGAVSGAASAVSGVVSTVGDVAASKIPSVNSVGQAGGSVSMDGPCRLVAKFIPVVNKDNQHKGVPLCDTRVLSTIPGYCEIYWPHLEINGATEEEVSAIYAMMEGGIYIE